MCWLFHTAGGGKGEKKEKAGQCLTRTNRIGGRAHSRVNQIALMQ